jgi:hypothetical protein
MRKKTSTVIGLAIATILIAYTTALTLSNQAFAQPASQVSTGRPLIGNVITQVGKVLAGHEAQLWKVGGFGHRHGIHAAKRTSLI